MHLQHPAGLQTDLERDPPSPPNPRLSERVVIVHVRY